MSQNDKGEPQPVYVIESIPVGGKNEVSDQEIARELIPTPPHLRIFPELGRGGMGRIHPATDRNLLRHVALKRLDKELDEEIGSLAAKLRNPSFLDRAPGPVVEKTRRRLVELEQRRAALAGA